MLLTDSNLLPSAATALTAQSKRLKGLPQF